MTVDRETIAVYDARADDYAAVFGKDKKPGPRLLDFCTLLPDGGRVLDFGCGPGTDAMHLMALGYSVKAFDASEAMVRAARSRGVDAYQAVFADFSETAVYDGIWANFSLLHASRDALPDHLAAIHAGLTPNGAFHIGVKTGDGSNRDGIGRRYTYYTPAELRGHLETAGFVIRTSTEGADPGLDGTVAPWIVYLCQRDG